MTNTPSKILTWSPFERKRNTKLINPLTIKLGRHTGIWVKLDILLDFIHWELNKGPLTLTPVSHWMRKQCGGSAEAVRIQSRSSVRPLCFHTGSVCRAQLNRGLYCNTDEYRHFCPISNSQHSPPNTVCHVALMYDMASILCDATVSPSPLCHAHM